MAPPLLLADFIAAFGENPLALPDGLVGSSSREDWARIVRLADEQGWALARNSDGGAVAVTAVLDDHRNLDSFALQPIPGILINWYPHGDDLRFDIDLREYTNQGALDVLCDVLERVGKTLGKVIWLAPEGEVDPVIRCDSASHEVSILERP